MTLRDSLLSAMESRERHTDRWRTFATQHAEVAPSVEEEAVLRTLLEAQFVPQTEWGALCVAAETVRQGTATTVLYDEALAQVDEAESFLSLTKADFLHWPWSTLDKAIGGMAPGTLHYVVCPSKGGKTTLCRSATYEWLHQGHKVFYGGFEMKASTLRTMFAADDCGMDPGDVMTGRWLDFPDYAERRGRMALAYREQTAEGSFYQNLRFSSFDTVGRDEVIGMMETAHAWGAKVVIIDHVDHVDGGTAANKGEYSVSVATNKLLLALTKRYNLVTIVTSQTNNTGKAQDRWRDFKPVREEVVKFGGHKKEVAHTMLGFYRPLKPGLTKEDRDRVEYGERSAEDFLLTGANAFNIIGHRAYGSHNGMRGYLGWERGRIIEPSFALLADIEAQKNAIKTNRSV